MRVKFFFFSTFIYTDLIYRVCCWKIQKLNTTETKKKIKKKRREKKSITKVFFSRVTGEFIASLTVDAVLKLCKSNSIFY